METNNVNQVLDNNQEPKAANESSADMKLMDFNFFKCCSASLRRFSLVMFIINVFFAVAIIGVAVVLIAVYLGSGMLSLLALPLFTVFLIFVVIARFISALIYGFAEIVEKNEKK